MKKRPRRSGQDEPPGEGPQPLQYKVVELSTVDEGAIERTLNEWVPKGWHLDGVQFAMRESSKRPAMAFVFFTRPGEAAEADPDAAKKRLRRLASEDHEPTNVTPISAWDRLAQLASDDEDEDKGP